MKYTNDILAVVIILIIGTFTLIFLMNNDIFNEIEKVNTKLDSLLQEKEIIYIPYDTVHFEKYDTNLVEINPYK